MKQGPVGLAETKWDDTESTRLAQRLADVFVYSTPGQLLNTGFRSGGVAWIMPSRWVAGDVISQVIVPAYALIVTRRTRMLSQHWIVVYLRSGHEVAILQQIRAWLRLHPLQGTCYLAGDFNSLPLKQEDLCLSFLAEFGFDYLSLPDMITFNTHGALGRLLDR